MNEKEGRPIISASSDPLGLRRTDATPAATVIAAEIRRGGPMNFHRFMELALYDPEVGYYARATAGPGPQRDYMTSPELHGAFGGMLCTEFEQMWRLLGEPDPFWVVEGGPGNGTMAADVLTYAQGALPRFYAALRMALIETNPALQQRQQARLAAWKDQVTWLDAAPESWPVLGDGCVVANELLDVFPIHLLVGTENGIQECFIEIENEGFVVTTGSPTSEALAEQIQAGGGSLEVGCYGEVSLEAPRWVGQTAQLIERGYVLIIDYGEPSDILYSAKHRLGTLRCYRAQVLVEDPLALPGQQDITEHVDLSAIVHEAEARGLAMLGATRQGLFLARLGIGDIIDRIDTGLSTRTDQQTHRAALDLMMDTGGLGRLAVLLFGKNVPDQLPAGFGD